MKAREENKLLKMLKGNYKWWVITASKKIEKIKETKVTKAKAENYYR